jgi:hypothetical protein
VITYEQRLDSDPGWALREGSRHFEERSAVQDALRSITSRLDELGIDYAVAGGMALFAHGLRRFTEDVDILVTGEGLKEIHRRLRGLGYVPPFTGSKNLRDTALGVRIEFLVAGDYPGDGKPKPVAFPEPVAVAFEHDGIRYLKLPSLIQLKLASGMSNPDRLKDLGDVQELIKLLALPADFADQLDPYVQPRFRELWHAARPASRRYVALHQRSQPGSGDPDASAPPAEDEQLVAMQADGIQLEPWLGAGDDWVYLVTTDPEVARKYGMCPEEEFAGPDEEADQQRTEP